MKVYFYVNDTGSQVGPLSLEEIKRLNLCPDTYVWTEGMADWAKLRDVPELASTGSPCPLPPPIEDDEQPPLPNSTSYQFDYRPNPPQKDVPGVCPPSYTFFAIATTICCFLPAGLVALVYAVRVSSLWSSGQYEAAQKSSNNAKLWSVISLIAGLAITLFYSFAFFEPLSHILDIVVNRT